MPELIAAASQAQRFTPRPAHQPLIICNKRPPAVPENPCYRDWRRPASVPINLPHQIMRFQGAGEAEATGGPPPRLLALAPFSTRYVPKGTRHKQQDEPLDDLLALREISSCSAANRFPNQFVSPAAIAVVRFR
jgi:hypothetical protein